MSKRNSNPKFTKAQFLQAQARTGWEKDILAAVLADGHFYSAVEADRAIQNYLKKGVK